MLKFGLALFFFMLTSLALAKDVSPQQVGVEYARGNFDKADAEYKESLLRVTNSEKRLADAQKQLAEDKQKSLVSKTNLDEAKAKYSKAQEMLDQAWKKP